MNAIHEAGGNDTKAIVTAWLAASAFDILAAFAYAIANGGTAPGVLRAVASGLLGNKVIGGGWDIAMIGLALHFAIMFGIVLVFWTASRFIPFLLARPDIVGPAYGVAVYAVMNLVVLPLSAIIFKPNYSWTPLLIGIATHMICVGLPIALVFHRYGRRGRPGSSAANA
ncbi:MAG: hypothetical protein LH481_02855 [Burkholderiales bacterium]|nr:hypothetical protein [Burkholderiales bacterium]